MSKFTRLAGIGAVAALAITVPATAAFAGGTPGPSPSPAHVRFLPEHFDIQLSAIDGLVTNDVRATGPVHFVRYRDAEPNPVTSVWSDGLGDSVRVWHSPLSTFNLRVNPLTCSVSLSQFGFWRFLAGTRLEAGATGHGVFQLVGLVSWDPVRGFCPVAHVNRFLILRALLAAHGFGPLPAPALESFSVQGAGVAALLPPVKVVPFTPTVTPTGSPSAYVTPTHT